MTKDYFVGPHGDGKWQVKQPKADRASGVFNTQAEAESQAKEWARIAGGGEVTIQRPDGRIRDKDTEPPKKDYFPPKG